MTAFESSAPALDRRLGSFDLASSSLLDRMRDGAGPVSPDLDHVLRKTIIHPSPGDRSLGH